MSLATAVTALSIDSVQTANIELEVTNSERAKEEEQNIVNKDIQTSSTTIDPTSTPITEKSYNANTFLANEYFCGRLIIVCVTIFLIVLSFAYAFGQLLTLKLSNYSCPKKTTEEINQHSIEFGLSEGDSDGCWRTKGFTVHEGALWSSESYSYEWDSTASGISRSVAFFALTAVLFGFLVQYIRIIINDLLNYKSNGQFGAKKSKKPSKPISKPSTGTCNNNIKCIIKYFNKIRAIIRFAVDSKPWIIKQIGSELFEIITQSFALLYYNGYIWNNSNDSDTVLAQPPKFVMLFAFFIFGNCISICIFWLLYAFRPLMCSGLLFYGLLYSNDVIFDGFYAIFPILIVLKSHNNAWIALASLQTDGQIGFWFVWIPLIFLCYNSFNLATKMRYIMSASLRLDNTETEDRNPQNTEAPPINRNMSTFTQDLLTSNFTTNNKMRKMSIIFIAFMFGAYGITILSLVLHHFDSSTNYCEMVIHKTDAFAEKLVFNTTTGTLLEIDAKTQTIIDAHPELLLWDHCKFKVYPFTSNNYQCQCRQFEMMDWDEFIWSVDELKMYFNVELAHILGHILQKWDMLEKLRWEDTDQVYYPYDPPALNMTQDMFHASKMRVFKVSATPISYMDDAISNWQLLSYFDFNGNDGITALPQTFGELHNLLYVSFGGLFAIEEFPIEICALSQLVTLIIELTSITTIPHCVGELQQLKSILLTLNDRLEYFPLNILNLHNLAELNVASTQITWSFFAEYNNITNITEFDEQFVWNPDATFWFQLSDFCSDIDSIPSVVFKKWISDVGSCQETCDFGNAHVGIILCTAYQWNNGVCDHLCNVDYCLYDGGDCSQLCDWSECDIESLGNGECDPGCNNAECNFDQYDCVDTITNYTECRLSFERGEHGCNASWIGDGYCDNNCQISPLCGFDEADCDNCDNNECSNAYALFDVGANQITRDDHIDDDEICVMWDIGVVTGLFDKLIAKQPELKNCSNVIPAMDRNEDGTLSFYEMIVGLHDVFYISYETALQINCAACVGGIEAYVN